MVVGLISTCSSKILSVILLFTPFFYAYVQRHVIFHTEMKYTWTATARVTGESMSLVIPSMAVESSGLSCSDSMDLSDNEKKSKEHDDRGKDLAPHWTGSSRVHKLSRALAFLIVVRLLCRFFEKVGPCMKVWVTIVGCGVLPFCFSERLKKICVDTLPTSRASVYALQNLYLAW